MLRCASHPISCDDATRADVLSADGTDEGTAGRSALHESRVTTPRLCAEISLTTRSGGSISPVSQRCQVRAGFFPPIPTIPAAFAMEILLWTRHCFGEMCMAPYSYKRYLRASLYICLLYTSPSPR